MSETQHDRELERYLQGNDPLSRAYDALRGEMPSPELDRKVLQKARDAVSRTRRFPVWQSYTAIAATVVLAFALVLRLDFGRMQAQAPSKAPLSELRSLDAVNADRPLYESPVTPPAETPTAESRTRSFAPQGTPVYTVPDESFALKRESVSPPSIAAEGLAKAEADAAAAKATTVGGGTRARAAAQTAAATGAEPPAISVESAAQAPAADASQGSAPAAPRPVLGRQLRVLPVAATSEERQAEVAPGMVEVSGSRLEKQQDLAEQAAGVPTRDPEEWLQAIEQLGKEGKTEEAEAEMRRFRLAYPDYEPKAAAEPTR